MSEVSQDPLQQASWMLQAGRPRQALEAAEQAVAARPEDSVPWRIKAEAHRQCSEREEALEASWQAVKQDPEDLPALRLLCVCLRWNERPREALSIANRMLEINAGVPNHHLAAARCMALISRSMGGHWELVAGARAALEQAAALAPEDPDVHAIAGDVFCIINNADMARTAFETALSLDPQHELALEGVLRVDASQGNLREAGEQGSLIMAMDPTQESSPRLLFHGYLRAAARVNKYCVWLLLPVFFVGMFAFDAAGPGMFIARAVMALALTAIVLRPGYQILASPAGVRRFLSGFAGFRPWLAGLALMPVCLLFVGAGPEPLFLWGIPMLWAAYGLQWVARGKVWEQIRARSEALRP